MKRWHLYLILAVLAVSIIAGVVLSRLQYGHIPSGYPPGTPPQIYSYQINATDTGLELPFFRTSQGQTQQFKLTLELSKSTPSISVPIENLTLTGYNSTIHDALDWQHWTQNNSVVQNSVFNYTVNKNPVTLQPGAINSTVLTLQWANDAPTGRYIIAVHLGNFSFLTPPEGDLYKPYSTIYTLFIELDPKAP